MDDFPNRDTISREGRNSSGLLVQLSAIFIKEKDSSFNENTEEEKPKLDVM